MSPVISFQSEGHETPGKSMPRQTARGQDCLGVGFMSDTRVSPTILGPNYCDGEFVPTRPEDRSKEEVTPNGNQGDDRNDNQYSQLTPRYTTKMKLVTLSPRSGTNDGQQTI